jgi:hypothetical protein
VAVVDMVTGARGVLLLPVHKGCRLGSQYSTPGPGSQQFPDPPPHAWERPRESEEMPCGHVAVEVLPTGGEVCLRSDHREVQ